MLEKYRLVTRSDFDGLVCAVLLKSRELIDDIKFVHPKDMQDGKIEITGKDITTNLPYVPGAHLVFDHHSSETLRNKGEPPENYILDPEAPSAARVVYEYYGGESAFPGINPEMVVAVDKGDSAQFAREEILFPKDWVLLNYLMDARTGLGRFKDFKVSNYELMMQLIDYCKDHPINEVLAIPDVKERIDLYFEHQRGALQQIERCAMVVGNVVVLDLRREEEIYASNRFFIYALYPEINVSIHVVWGLQKQNTVFAVGASIIDRSCKTDIGHLMLKHGGGGHKKAGTCQIDNDNADDVLDELITTLNAEN
ncbi:MAG: exopolyphosphatase [Gammaproteobacteria bacterium]|nr:exopolyphosphatase [Gammaproteobacteria bacterium]